MKNFCRGIIFITILIPLLENLLNIIAQLTEYFCTKIASKTYNIRKGIQEEEEEPQKTFAIGFHAPIEAEEYEEEDDDL